MNRRLWGLLAATLLISSCQFLSDGGTEIPNELTGNLYLQGGTAAVNAEVILYPVDYLPGSGTAASKRYTHTDAKGKFSFRDLPEGRYNLIGKLGLSDSLFCFSDSLTVAGKVKAPSDTLKHPGSLTGKIQIDTSGDPSTATVQVVGTDYFGLVDSNGIFKLQNVAQGNYQLRVVTTLPEYAPALEQVTVQSGRNDTLEHVIVIYPKHFPVTGSTTAQWTFDAYYGGNRVADFGSNDFPLSPSKTISLEASPFGYAAVLNGTGQFFSVANSPVLTIGGTGKITYEARIYLSQYPSVNNFNEESLVMGMHEGLSLAVGANGSLVAGTQKQAINGGAYFYAPASVAGTVPLNRWVDVAVALDQARNQCYGYVDGTPVQLAIGFVNADPFRVSTSAFTVGNDSRDSQQFIGKIDEIRISNSLIKGAGLPLLVK